MDPVNAILSSRVIARLIVVDNDPPPSARFSASAYTVTEAAGAVTMTVLLSAASGNTVIITYTVGGSPGRLPWHLASSVVPSR